MKERSRAGQGYEIEFRPKTELHISQAVRPRVDASEMYPSSVERKWKEQQLESDQLPVCKEGTGRMKLDVDEGQTIEHARTEVLSLEGDRVSHVNISQLEPIIEPRTSHVPGALG